MGNSTITASPLLHFGPQEKSRRRPGQPDAPFGIPAEFTWPIGPLCHLASFPQRMLSCRDLSSQLEERDTLQGVQRQLCPLPESPHTPPGNRESARTVRETRGNTNSSVSRRCPPSGPLTSDATSALLSSSHFQSYFKFQGCILHSMFCFFNSLIIHHGTHQSDL